MPMLFSILWRGVLKARRLRSRFSCPLAPAVCCFYCYGASDERKTLVKVGEELYLCDQCITTMYHICREEEERRSPADLIESAPTEMRRESDCPGQ